MNVRNCMKCGKIFNYAIGRPICPACKDKMDEKFRIVKEYIREHKIATMTEVCEECDVDASQIRQWIREDRLQFSDDSPIKIPCEGCGKMIGSGKFCPACAANLAHGFGSTIQKPVTQEENRYKKASHDNKMRFLQ